MTEAAREELALIFPDVPTELNASKTARSVARKFEALVLLSQAA
jgi:hypothetical protein